ncbi:MAG: hypothetical protein HFG98_13380 [Dorea sp.]|nr:hypothetical protein [Dorea sp.]
MLKGEYSHNIDAKGRLIIPAKMRDDLGEHFVITKGMENCLFSSVLRDYAKLDKEVVFIGMGKRAEIWDKARWDEKNAEVELSIEDIASDMEASGFSI